MTGTLKWTRILSLALAPKTIKKEMQPSNLTLAIAGRVELTKRTGLKKPDLQKVDFLGEPAISGWARGLKDPVGACQAACKGHLQDLSGTASLGHE